MAELFEILSFSFSCLLWGVLAAIVCLSLLGILLRGWSKKLALGFSGCLAGTVLFVVLSFQFTLMAGAVKIIGLSKRVEVRIGQTLGEQYPPEQKITELQSAQLMEQLGDTYPVLKNFLPDGDFTGCTVGELPVTVGSGIRSFMRFYVLRRVLWSLGFLVAGAVLAVRSLPKGYDSLHSRRRTSQTGSSSRRRRY